MHDFLNPQPIVTDAGYVPEELKYMLLGKPKSGKTVTSLQMALTVSGIDFPKLTRAQVQKINQAQTSPVVILSTVNENVQIYAKDFPMRLIPYESGPYHPRVLWQLIEKYDADPSVSALVVDSMTPFWNGPGGGLAIVESLSSGGKNSMGAWGEYGKVQGRMFQAFNDTRLHLFFTIQAEDKIKVTPKKDGPGVESIESVADKPIQRQVTPFHTNHLLIFNRTDHTAEFAGRFLLPGGRSSAGTTIQLDAAPVVKFTRQLMEWHNQPWIDRTESLL